MTVGPSAGRRAVGSPGEASVFSSTHAARIRSPSRATDLGLYVHYPYCLRLCPYCDFNVAVGPRPDERYTDAVLAELATRAPAYGPGPLASIYFGGGTPSLWPAAQIGRVIEAARGQFGLRADAEITIEANPEGMTQALVAQWRAVGINRVSLGIQSFVASELRVLGRAHGPDDAAAAFAAAKASGIRTSVDLIYGLPGQNPRAIGQSLQAVLSMAPDHVSAYGLTIESGTFFAKAIAAKKMAPTDDDQQAAAMARVVTTLAAHGWRRYEVSSFARQRAAGLGAQETWEPGPPAPADARGPVDSQGPVASRGPAEVQGPADSQGPAGPRGPPEMPDRSTTDRPAGPVGDPVDPVALDNVARHNSLYWAGAGYLGLGAGAHSFHPGDGAGQRTSPGPAGGPQRRENRRAPEGYIADALAGRDTPSFVEQLSPTAVRIERILVGCRTVFGLDLAALELDETQQGPMAAAVDRLVRRGWLDRWGDHVAPTAVGLDFADAIAQSLAACA